jgi:hypothetical protein
MAFAIARRPAYLAGVPYGDTGNVIPVAAWIARVLGLPAGVRTIPANMAETYARKLDLLASQVSGSAFLNRANNSTALQKAASALRAAAGGQPVDGSYVPPATHRASDGSYVSDRPTTVTASRPTPPVVGEEILTVEESGGVGSYIAAAVVLAGLAGGSWYAAKRFGYIGTSRSNPRRRNRSRK